MKSERSPLWVIVVIMYVLALVTCKSMGINYSQADITQAITTVYPTKDYVISDFIVTGFGAKAEPGFDNRAAFQSAIDAAYRDGGGVVYIPAGTYEFRSTSTGIKAADHSGIGTTVTEDHSYEYVLRLLQGVQLRGDWISPELNDGKVEGTVLAVYAGRNSPNYDTMTAAKYWTGDTEMSVADRFIDMLPSTGVTNLSIWYPEQDVNNIVPYPWTIMQSPVSFMQDLCATVENVTLVNSYNGIFACSGNLHYLFNSYITALNSGIKITRCADIGRIENIKIKPKYWAESGLPNSPSLDAVTAITRENGIGIHLHFSEWEYVTNVHITGYDIGMMLDKQPVNGIPMNGQLYGLVIDNCKTGIYALDILIYGLIVSNSTFISSEEDRNVYISPLFNTSIQFNGVQFTGPIVSEATGGVISFENCTFDGYRDYALDFTGGNMLLTQCEFKKPDGHVKLGPDFSLFKAMNSGYGAVIHQRNLVYTNEGNASVEFNNGEEYIITPIPHNIITDITIQPKPPEANVLRFIYGRQNTSNRFGDQIGGAPIRNISAALQAALDAVSAAGGGTVFLPGGRYLLNDPIVVPSGVELRGSFDVQHHKCGGGTALFTRYTGGRSRENGIPLIRLEVGAGLRGFKIYQQNLIGGFDFDRYNPLSIRQTPFLIQGMGPNVYAINITVVMGDKGIDFASFDTSGHYIEYFGGALAREGIWVGGGADGGFVRNVQLNAHYDHWLGLPPGNQGYKFADIHRFQRKYLTTFKIGDVTNQTFFNNFAYAAINGIHFHKDIKTGRYPGVLTGIGNGIDGSTRAIFLEHADENTKITLINSQLVPVGIEPDKSYIRIGENTEADIHPDAQLILYNSTFWGITDRGAVVHAGTLRLYQGNFAAPGNPSVHVLGGSAHVFSSKFLSPNNETFGHLASAGNILEFSNNYFSGGLLYENEKPAGYVFGTDIMPVELRMVSGEGEDPGTLAKKLHLSVTSGTYSGKIHMVYPSSYAAGFNPVRFNSLSEGEELLMDLPYYSGDRITFEIELINDRKLEYSFFLNRTFADHYNGVRGLETGSTPLLIADTDKSVVLGTWDGPDDASFKGNVKWDNSFLYLFLVVTDDIHHSAFPGGNSESLWQGDAVQLAVNMNKSASEGGQSSSTDLGFALHENGSIESYVWYPQSYQLRPSGWNRLFLITRNDDAKTTTYDITIPWSVFSRNAERDLRNNKLGLSIMVCDSDGPDTGWTAFTYGGTSLIYKNYSSAMDLYLMGAGEYELLVSNSAEAAVRKAEQSRNVSDHDMAYNHTIFIRNVALRGALESRLAVLALQ